MVRNKCLFSLEFSVFIILVINCCDHLLTDGIAILSAGGVHVYEINSGTPLWTKQLPDR